ncbi:MAG: alpha/beta hydrolase [Saprospiraceae bacterium]|nr:alpha/beta hydrolase [Saprospiraceae bacterium]MCB9312943.1 alpha/beta hydrolase [Lewinellaceae bacterium]HRW74376.1 alpha/beta hydrolase [Saprospiraceae bacterium]
MSSIPVVKYGSGPIPVFLLHGFCEDRRIFEQILPGLDQKKYTCYLPDLPGFGDAANLGLLEFSMTGYADQVRDWIVDHNKGKVILAGHSMGGYVALEFASHYPEMLHGVILMHSQIQADSPERRESRDEHLAFLEKNGLANYAKRLIPALYKPSFRQSHSDWINLWIQRVSLYSDRGVSLAIQAMRDRKDLREMIRELPIPLGYIAGAEDPVIAREVSLEESHLASITNFHMLNGAGHMGMIEDSDAFLEALISCIDSIMVSS